MRKKIQEKFFSRRWYIQGINAVPAFIHAADVSGIKYMKKNFGFGYTNFIYFFKKDYIELHYDRDDLHFLADKIMRKYFKNPHYLNKLLEKSAQDKAPFYRYLREKMMQNPNPLTELDNQELIREYKKVFQLFCRMFTTSHLVEPLALTTDVKLKDWILKDLSKKGLIKNFSQYFSLLTQPVHKSYLNNYNQDLKKIIDFIKRNSPLKSSLRRQKASQIKKFLSKKPKLNRLIQNHLTKYFWIKANWREGADYTLEEVIRILQRIIKGQDTLEVFSEKDFRKNLSAKNKLMRNLKLSRKVVQLIKLIDLVTRWQDDRKKDINIGTWVLDKFVKEMAKRFKINRLDLCYLWPKEITLSLLKKPGLKRELASRRNYSVYLVHRNEEDVLSGKKARRFMKKLREKKESSTREINGLVASLGKVSGFVKICLTIEEVEEVKKGEILVSTMTRPEFIPAMRKAAAVVTDEGGLTCHAAIISRELGIPCIIGTKIATRVLKNGDLVEVNAQHGVVKIINHKN